LTQEYSIILPLAITIIFGKDGIDLTDSPTLGVNNVGVYTVEVINNSGCSRIRTITVNSNVATVDSIDIIDLTDTNSITVNTTGPGIMNIV
jgi:hypothetical protein